MPSARTMPSRVAAVCAAALLPAATLALHVRAASARSMALLEHDEAISLLVAAGKSDRFERLHEAADRVQVLPAARMQDWLRWTGDAGFGDVVRSCREHDIHPPLYFLSLHALQRAGIREQWLLRLIGSIAIVAAVVVAGRILWPGVPWSARAAAFILLAMNPVAVRAGTELRQYGLVYAGALLALAALVMFTRHSAARWRPAAFAAGVAAASVWSQFGTAVWLVILLAAAAVFALRGDRSSWITLGLTIGVAALLLAPILLVVPDAMPVAARDWAAERALSPRTNGRIAADVISEAGSAWWSLPYRWETAPARVAAAVVTFLAAAAAAWRRRREGDRTICLAVAAWAVTWIILAAVGRIPLHAVGAKQLAPLVIGPVVLLARATAGANPPWLRRLAGGLLAVSVLSHATVAWPSLLSSPRPAPWTTALSETDGLLVRTPKRGQLLPLVARMKPDAAVIIAELDVAARDWPQLSAALPPDRLVWAEIDTYDAAAAGALRARLVDRYDSVNVLRSGPSRRMTEFCGAQD